MLNMKEELPNRNLRTLVIEELTVHDVRQAHGFKPNKNNETLSLYCMSNGYDALLGWLKKEGFAIYVLIPRVIVKHTKILVKKPNGP